MGKSLHNHKKEVLEETTERIVIDYSNLSGRESANRAEFRERVRKNVSHALDSQIEILRGMVEKLEWEEMIDGVYNRKMLGRGEVMGLFHFSPEGSQDTKE